MRIKDGVRFHTGIMAMLHASMVVDGVCRELFTECVLTGGSEGRHFTSPHFHGYALDYRANHIDRALAERVSNKVRERLGDGYDVVLHEGESGELHLHVEYDPKD